MTRRATQKKTGEIAGAISGVCSRTLLAPAWAFSSRAVDPQANHQHLVVVALRHTWPAGELLGNWFFVPFCRNKKGPLPEAKER